MTSQLRAILSAIPISYGRECVCIADLAATLPDIGPVDIAVTVRGLERMGLIQRWISQYPRLSPYYHRTAEGDYVAGQGRAAA